VPGTSFTLAAVQILLLPSLTTRTMGMEPKGLVWPAPSVMELYTTVDQPILQVVNRQEFDFSYSGHVHDTRLFLEEAEKRFLAALDRQAPPSAKKVYPINPTHKDLWATSGLRIQVSTTDSRLRHGVDESYALEVPPVIDSDLYILLNAQTVFGVVRGLQTLLQVLEFGWIDSNGHDVFLITNPPLFIVDRPIYPYRGLMIDTSRHYLPLSLILNNLDAMEMNKLNALHWHLTDSQSWPYQSAMYPELAAKGAYCEKCVYGALDIQRVVREAADRGIRVVLEIDLPGHSQCTFASSVAFWLLGEM
jgi:Glycosyl hydrolase family 20, catalytic domain/beta-acetyl hexosaminidase like